MAYDASDRKDIRRAEKAARQSELVRIEIVKSLMAHPDGRAFIYQKLASAHMFVTSFNSDPLRMAFSEGERNSGIELFDDILSNCPNLFVLMLQERNASNAARRSSDSNGHQRSPSDPDRRDSPAAGDQDEVGVDLYTTEPDPA